MCSISIYLILQILVYYYSFIHKTVSRKHPELKKSQNDLMIEMRTVGYARHVYVLDTTYHHEIDGNSDNDDAHSLLHISVF